MRAICLNHNSEYNIFKISLLKVFCIVYDAMSVRKETKRSSIEGRQKETGTGTEIEGTTKIREIHER